MVLIASLAIVCHAPCTISRAKAFLSDNSHYRGHVLQEPGRRDEVHVGSFITNHLIVEANIADRWTAGIRNNTVHQDDVAGKRTSFFASIRSSHHWFA